MKTYTEIKYHFCRTNISISETDTLIFERRTPLSYRLENIPLTAFASAPEIIEKQPGVISKSLFKLGCFCSIAFLVILYRNQEFSSSINAPLSYLLIITFIVISALYYFITTKHILNFFFYNNQRSGFTLSYIKDNKEQKKFMETFKVAVKNARVNYDNNNFKIIQKGIDSLEKQQIIGQSFAAELQHRLGHLMYAKI